MGCFSSIIERCETALWSSFIPASRSFHQRSSSFCSIVIVVLVFLVDEGGRYYNKCRIIDYCFRVLTNRFLSILYYYDTLDQLPHGGRQTAVKPFVFDRDGCEHESSHCFFDTERDASYFVTQDTLIICWELNRALFGALYVFAGNDGIRSGAECLFAI